MTTSSQVDVHNKGVFIATVTAGKNESSPAIEVGHIDRLSVATRYVTGSTQTLTVQGSNDGTNWFPLHTTEWAAAGGNEPLSARPDAGGHNLNDVLEHPRYVRINVTNTAGGDTDQLEAVFSGSVRK